MSKLNLAIVGLIFLAASLSCKWLPGKSTKTASGPPIDFTTPGKALNVKVTLDKKHTASDKISPDGGTLSLTSADGSKFMLEVPAKALDAETTITMTALKSMDGAPLDNNRPAAVQLEPSGLFFNEMVTLTIVPANEIQTKQQIAFGYEGDGKDYHLALVDPESKDIKIKLMEFSGAGVGSAGDAAWALNLQTQAENARTRLTQKIGELTQTKRMQRLLGHDEGPVDWDAEVVKTIERYNDQVLIKEMAAAELDCRLARRARENFIGADRQKALLGAKTDPNFWQKVEKLEKLMKECKKPAAFQIAGGLDDWHTNTKVCDIMVPFKLTGGGIVMELTGGLAGTYEYSGPFGAHGTGTYTISLPGGLDKPGSMVGGGEGSAGGASNSGIEKYTLTPIPPCGETETK
jgi:hypothetical protein